MDNKECVLWLMDYTHFGSR